MSPTKALFLPRAFPNLSPLSWPPAHGCRQYLDLCALASREAPPCGPGYKFLVRVRPPPPPPHNLAGGEGRAEAVPGLPHLLPRRLPVQGAQGDRLPGAGGDDGEHHLQGEGGGGGEVEVQEVAGAAELPLAPLDRRPGRRGVKGQHCDYIRLCDVGCASGEKFLVQVPPSSTVAPLLPPTPTCRGSRGCAGSSSSPPPPPS